MDCARAFVESDESPGRVRTLMQSPNIYIARAATFAFSRTARHPPDFVAMLEEAKARKILDDDALYGEFAHAVRFASHPVQLEMITKIHRANNAYARDILASGFNHPSSLPMLGHAAQRALDSLLLQNEPTFGQALGEYGGFDAFRYSDWLSSVAMLQSGGSLARYNAFVLAALDDSRTDPRKIMAFLHSQQGAQLIKSVGAVRLANAIRRIADYSDSLPQHQPMRDAVAEVKQRALRAGPAGSR
jgi:hypothetical protein